MPQNWIDGVPPLPAQGGNKWDGYRATAAIAAMQCVLSSDRIMLEVRSLIEQGAVIDAPREVAKTAVQMAYALIAELQRTEK